MSKDQFDIARALALRSDRLAEKGFCLDVTHDFDHVSGFLRALGKGYQTPTLSHQWNDYTPETSFWMTISCGQQPLGAIGVKREILGREPVSKYWKRVFQRHYGSSSKGDVIVSVSNLVDQKLGGDLAYFGDLHISNDVRRAKVIDHFGHAALFHSAIAWGCASYYAFIKERDLVRGLGVRLGLMSCIKNAQVWSDPPPETRGNHEACCHSSLLDVVHLARLDTGQA